MMNHELTRLLPQSIDGLVRIRANLLIATARLEALRKEPGGADQAHEQAIARVETEIALSIRYAREQETLIREMTELVERLLNQYESANNAYQRGWDDRLDDLLVRLNGGQAKELLAILKKVSVSDQPF